MVSTRPLRLLVTDDDPIQLRAAARLLKTLGHTGALATQGQMALDLLERQSFDVMLLDLRMPVLDGLETLARLRPRHPKLPVVLVSGDDLGVNWSFYRDAGADAYLVKPLDIDTLSALLQRRLR
ncbi:response regulator [Hydrogenophaga sp. RWCD_12]|uniref:response regulator n=1 Tax=Hydrogenophaga sp. RWCD_12 TaxID=3391190 RepID=UPI003984E201